MSSPADDIADLLEEVGFQNVFVSREPSSPDETITLYDTPGGSPLDYSLDFRQPNIQVRIRAIDYKDAFTNQGLVFNFLTSTEKQTSNFRYVGFELVGDFSSLGRDEKDRVVTVSNYRVLRHPK